MLSMLKALRLLTLFLISSFCDGSHLSRMVNELTAFNDYKQYGQLASRAAGLLVSDGPRLFQCV